MKSLAAFLDSSVILSGLASSEGGSFQLFAAAKKEKLRLISTPLIIEEVARHLTKIKVKPAELKNLLNQRLLRLIPNPEEKIIFACKNLTPDPNDAHVLAGAILAKTDFLLSLDKKHILTETVKKHLYPIKILSPFQFWQLLAARY